MLPFVRGNSHTRVIYGECRYINFKDRVCSPTDHVQVEGLVVGLVPFAHHTARARHRAKQDACRRGHVPLYLACDLPQEQIVRGPHGANAGIGHKKKRTSNRANSSISAMRPLCYYLLEEIVILGVIYGGRSRSAPATHQIMCPVYRFILLTVAFVDTTVSRLSLLTIAMGQSQNPLFPIYYGVYFFYNRIYHTTCTSEPHCIS